MLDPATEPPIPPPDPLLQPPPKQKRSSVACRRCRRLRAKCVKDEGGGGLCRGCIDAGVPNECQFLPRGMSAIDRAPRPVQKRKRQKRESPEQSDFTSFGHSESLPPQSHPIHAIVDGVCTTCHQHVPANPDGIHGHLAATTSEKLEDLLPPQEELIDGCEWFFTTYFQLGFLHKPTFMHQLISTPASISPFLLLSMLSVSARFTPSLVQRYGGGAAAAAVFAKRAQQLAGEEILGVATLERAQGFFLCSICNWGGGYKDRSWIFLGVAARMVSILKLSQEDSYKLPPQPRVEEVIATEVSRRTWWVIFMSDNLLSSGCGRPISFDLEQVTIPLPLDEDHFYFGQQGPATVLPGTSAKPQQRATHIDPQLQKGSDYESANEGVYGTGVGDRSLYGNLITIADIWARVARSAMQRTKDTFSGNSNGYSASSILPWLPESDLDKFDRQLQDWEHTLGPRQSWSQSNLLAYQQKSLDMGFRGIFLIMHLAHIVLRRSYLPMLVHDVQKQSRSSSPNYASGGPRQSSAGPNGNGRHEYPYSDNLSAPPHFWEKMVNDMFVHALRAIELVESWVPTRPFSKGCTPMMGFSLFMAGSVLCYLRRWRWLSPDLYPHTERAVQSALVMIDDIAIYWPSMGTRWHAALKASFESSTPSEGGQKDPSGETVEGLGRATAEDLTNDNRDGMYRHQSVDTERPNESRRASSSSARNSGMSSTPAPSKHDAHMLYSLATAASMDHKSGPPPPPGRIPPHFQANMQEMMQHGHMGAPQTVDWQHVQGDLSILLQDDLGTHLEHGGDGWAF